MNFGPDQVTLFVADLTFSGFFSSRVTRFRECSLGDAGDFGDVGNVGVDGFGENNDDWVVMVVMVVTRVMRDSVVETFQVQSPAQPLKDHGINLETTSIGFIYWIQLSIFKEGSRRLSDFYTHPVEVILFYSLNSAPTTNIQICT